jgi:ActR/RegA family two-component response regulator
MSASVLEAALLLAPKGTIRAEDLLIPPYAETRPATQAATCAGATKLDDLILHHVQNVLDMKRGNKLRAARQLGSTRSALNHILGNEPAFAR